MNYRFSSNPQVGTAESRPLSPRFYHRLLSFYLSQPSAEGHLSPIWEGMYKTVLRPLIDVLDSNDPAALEKMLSNLYHNGAVSGLDCPAGEEKFVEFWEHACLNASMALGVLPVPNTEQGHVATTVDYEALLDEMETVIARRIHWPIGGQAPSIHSKGRWCPYKLFEAIVVCNAAQRMGLADDGDVLEIGAGFGALPGLLYLCDLGHRIHVVDLPVVSVVQAYLCASVFGETQIRLFGEISGARIVIHGLHVPSLSLSAVFNINSLPELPETEAMEYIKTISGSLTPNGFFLSVNHEGSRGGQRRVYDLAKGSKLRLRQRSPWWMRNGYVQEVYTL